ncbi:uncharacterized protein LOC125567878 [Nematostella vectensis]|uniref:uncharacterized protein LOC125567878 n=1 Tax=Nematostella vectensis TaxID=45351 RepID=UPI00207779AF|nr:uncharacterized protein LOC125567878 [Nematostella vectensis]
MKIDYIIAICSTVMVAIGAALPSPPAHCSVTSFMYHILLVLEPYTTHVRDDTYVTYQNLTQAWTPSSQDSATLPLMPLPIGLNGDKVPVFGVLQNNAAVLKQFRPLLRQSIQNFRQLPNSTHVVKRLVTLRQEVTDLMAIITMATRNLKPRNATLYKIPPISAHPRMANLDRHQAFSRVIALLGQLHGDLLQMDVNFHQIRKRLCGHV